MATRTYSVATVTHEQITKIAKHTGFPQSVIIREAIREYYEKWAVEINSAYNIPKSAEPGDTALDIF